jgi:hypothetical protein
MNEEVHIQVGDIFTGGMEMDLTILGARRLKYFTWRGS